MFPLLVALGSSNGPTPPASVLPIEDGTAETIFTKTTFIWLEILGFFLLFFYNKNFSWTSIISAILAVMPSYIFFTFIREVCEDKNNFVYSSAEGSLVALSCAISLGNFIGTVKLLHYVWYGLVFTAANFLAQWVNFSGHAITGAYDPGFAIRVHLFAAYFGYGCTLVIQEKRVVDQKPPYTKSSFTIIWLASLLIAFSWPMYASVFYANTNGFNAGVCYTMAMAASILIGILVDYILEPNHLLDPYLISQCFYAGCVGVSTSIFVCGPWGSLAIGAISGGLMPLFKKYVARGLTKKCGVADILGVHNVHGLCGWISVLCGMISGYCDSAEGVWTFVAGLITFGIAIICGAITGLVINLAKCGEIVSSEFMTDFTYFAFPETDIEKANQTAEEI